MIDQGPILQNTIWHQIIEMINNEFIFQALFLSGNKIGSQQDFNFFLGLNKTLGRYRIGSYFSIQYLYIRKLTEKYYPSRDKKNEKDEVSIARLFNNMEVNEAFITREAFVCVDGLPFSYLEDLNKKIENTITCNLNISEKEGWIGKPGYGKKSLLRHLVFDRTSSISNSQQRSLPLKLVLNICKDAKRTDPAT